MNTREEITEGVVVREGVSVRDEIISQNLEGPKPNSLVVSNQQNENMSIKDNEIMKVDEEPVNRKRRAYYIFTVTAFSLFSSVGLIIFGYENSISEKVALSLLDLVQVFGIVYVTAGVIDRGGVIAKVIEATRRRR